MKKINSDHTYYGFLIIKNKAGLVVNRQEMTSCSQTMKTIGTHIKDGSVEFYVPNDWLLPVARNSYFLKYWVSLAKTWFTDIEYLGKFKISETGLVTDVKKVNTAFGYSYDNDKISEISYIKNRGDLIMNDIWRGFIIKGKFGSSTNLEYTAYCMIRYLFCSHFQPIVSNYLYFTNLSLYSKFDKFKLFQISHYLGSLNVCYNGKYGFIGDVKRECSCHKLVELKDVVAKLKSGRHLNSVMTCMGASKYTRKEIEQLIEDQKIKEIYEALS